MNLICQFKNVMGADVSMIVLLIVMGTVVLLGLDIYKIANLNF